MNPISPKSTLEKLSAAVQNEVPAASRSSFYLPVEMVEKVAAAGSVGQAPQVRLQLQAALTHLRPLRQAACRAPPQMALHQAWQARQSQEIFAWAEAALAAGHGIDVLLDDPAVHGWAIRTLRHRGQGLPPVRGADVRSQLTRRADLARRLGRAPLRAEKATRRAEVQELLLLTRRLRKANLCDPDNLVAHGHPEAMPSSMLAAAGLWRLVAGRLLDPALAEVDIEALAVAASMVPNNGATMIFLTSCCQHLSAHALAQMAQNHWQEQGGYSDAFAQLWLCLELEAPQPRAGSPYFQQIAAANLELEKLRRAFRSPSLASLTPAAGPLVIENLELPAFWSRAQQTQAQRTQLAPQTNFMDYPRLAARSCRHIVAGANDPSTQLARLDGLAHRCVEHDLPAMMQEVLEARRQGFGSATHAPLLAALYAAAAGHGSVACLAALHAMQNASWTPDVAAAVVLATTALFDVDRLTSLERAAQCLEALFAHRPDEAAAPLPALLAQACENATGLTEVHVATPLDVFVRAVAPHVPKDMRRATCRRATERLEAEPFDVGVQKVYASLLNSPFFVGDLWPQNLETEAYEQLVGNLENERSALIGLLAFARETLFVEEDRFLAVHAAFCTNYAANLLAIVPPTELIEPQQALQLLCVIIDAEVIDSEHFADPSHTQWLHFDSLLRSGCAASPYWKHFLARLKEATGTDRLYEDEIWQQSVKTLLIHAPTDGSPHRGFSPAHLDFVDVFLDTLQPGTLKLLHRRLEGPSSPAPGKLADLFAYHRFTQAVM